MQSSELLASDGPLARKQTAELQASARAETVDKINGSGGVYPD